MKTNILLILFIFIILSGCGSVKLKKTDKVLEFFKCTEFTVNEKTKQLFSKDKKCNCVIKKIESMKWSSEETCLIRTISKPENTYCVPRTRDGEIRIFRPFIETIIRLNRQCYVEATGKKYPYMM